MRPAGEQVRIGERESDHPVGHVGQAIRAGQRSGEQLDQAPGHQDPHHIAGHQHAGRLDQRAPADLGPELPIGQHQQDDRDDVQSEPEILAQDLGGGVAPAAISAAFRPAARIMLPSNSSQAIRLRAVRAAANKANTNDHAMLVSGS